MKRFILLGYQVAAGGADALTGALLVAEPALALQWMGLRAPADAMPFIAYIGSFVLAVGLCYLYGAMLVWRCGCISKVETIWLLTAIVRISVAAFVFTSVLSRALDVGWSTVGVFDCACALIQAVGLRKGWLLHVEG